MNQLHSIRANIFYRKDENDNFKKVIELVFLCQKPTYGFSNEGTMIRSRQVEENRILINEENIDDIIDILSKIKTSSEKDYE